MNASTPRIRLKDWAEEDRPREKILLKGIESLSDAELLATLIGSGSKEQTVVELAHHILQSAKNNLSELSKFSINQLISDFKGIGEAKAITIVAAMELGKRRKMTDLLSKTQIASSQDIYEIFHPILCDLQQEEFWVLFLNKANRITGKVRISRGGVSETVVDCKLIFKEAISRLACGIILCHNHPSGNSLPSRQDDALTQKIKEGAKHLDVILLDHLVFCEGSYFSYLDEGRL